MYVEALPLLVRNPTLFLAPLVTGVINVFVQEVVARTGSGDAFGSFTGGIVQLLIFLIDSFGLAVSVIIADRCWRNGHGSFDEGWEEARRRAGDILMAALGLNFLVYVALQLGSFLNPYLGVAFFAAAFFFLIYTIPAAAIGGIPGVAALNVSIERVREDVPTALGLAVCFVVLYWLLGIVLVPLYTIDFGIVSYLTAALVKAIALGYFSLVLARAYGTVFFRR